MRYYTKLLYFSYYALTLLIELFELSPTQDFDWLLRGFSERNNFKLHSDWSVRPALFCDWLRSESRTPVAVIREREVKWVEMLNNWERWMSKQFKKVSYFHLYRSAWEKFYFALF